VVLPLRPVKLGSMSGVGYVVVIGGANIDVKARSASPILRGTSNPGHTVTSPGGVGRNIAENLARLGTMTFLVTAIGRDVLGDRLLDETSMAGVRVEHALRTDAPTGTYTAVLDSDGELVVAVADMAATAALDVAHLRSIRELIRGASLVVMDGNLSDDVLGGAVDIAADRFVVLDPVSVPKAARLGPLLSKDRSLFAVTPNRDELAAMTGMAVSTDVELALAAGSLHDRGVRNVWVRLGACGSLLFEDGREAVAFSAVSGSVVDVTGAGDAMVGAFAHAIVGGQSLNEAARFAHAAAALTIASAHTVRPDINVLLVESKLRESCRSTP
jgi:pseudouridine kinase